MTPTLRQSVGQKMMLSFRGTEATPDILAAIQAGRMGGLTLFRSFNVAGPAQVRRLTGSLQAAARQAGQPPLLIGVDQEGGTLLAIPGTTALPGNLALGATRSADLAYRAGQVLGRELGALGVNVDYAPVCDVNVNPRNPVVGPRSFGEDPDLVAQLAAAMIQGLQTAGTAATAKHFPGHGDTATDSHDGAPRLLHAEERLRRIELPPFAAAIRAGVKLVMTGHLALPSFDGVDDLPATLSPRLLRGLLRGELGYSGVTITDAMDMNAIRQGPGLLIDALAAARAGCDLLLLNNLEPKEQLEIYEGLVQAAERQLLDGDDLAASAGRILRLKDWCALAAAPPLEVVGCAEHLALADEIAARSITLVRDTAGLLPLRPPPEARIAVIVPRPRDLTPADTSSYEKPDLAAAIRVHHANTDEFLVPLEPAEDEIAALKDRAAGYNLVIIGTLNAAVYPRQAALVNAILAGGAPTVAVALRMPYDLQVFPAATAYVCAYGLQPATLKALARCLFGLAPFTGKLPVTIAGQTDAERN